MRVCVRAHLWGFTGICVCMPCADGCASRPCRVRVGKTVACMAPHPLALQPPLAGARSAPEAPISDEVIAENLGPDDAARWRSIIAADVEQQRNTTTVQNADVGGSSSGFSSAYLALSPQAAQVQARGRGITGGSGGASGGSVVIAELD